MSSLWKPKSLASTTKTSWSASQVTSSTTSRTGRQRHERGSVHDGAVEGESTSVVRQRRQHDRGSASGDDERHDEETRDETEDLGSSVVRIERLRRVCHAVMERWDTSRRHG